METFIQRFSDRVTGTLSGFDRLVLRGALRLLTGVQGMAHFLSLQGIRLVDFADYVHQTTEQIKAATILRAEKLGRPIIYLPSPKQSKEKVALEVARRDKICDGLIGILSTVELCKTYAVRGDRKTKHIDLAKEIRKCLYFYHYYFHPEFGLINARIQTWFPFDIQICLNGREWLSKKLDKNKIEYRRSDNCFNWLSDSEKAQKLMDTQLQLDWPRALKKIARDLNPAHKNIFTKVPLEYYWTVHQSEWATDIMFRSPKDLAEIYRPLVQYGITHFSSPDVMRFLGKRIIPAFKGEIMSDFKDRPEGIRIKHYLGFNSVKLYDKAGSVLRAETTINTPYDLKVYRPKENDPNGELAWRPLRKGIADLYRRAQYSQTCNERYLNALGAFAPDTYLGDVLRDLSKRVPYKGSFLRGLRPWQNPEDFQLLKSVARGEFKLSGLRNKDIQALLFRHNCSDKQRRSRSSKVSRLLRLLRAHGLLRKIPSTHRYILTDRGTQILNTLFSIDRLKLSQLTASA